MVDQIDLAIQSFVSDVKKSKSISNTEKCLTSSFSKLLEERLEFVPSKSSVMPHTLLRKKYKSLNSVIQKDIDTLNSHEKKKVNLEICPSEVIKLDWPSSRRQVASGLKNLGNTCFLNSTLQCLLHTPPLYNYLTSKLHKCQTNKYCMACGLKKLISVAFDSNGQANPTFILQNLRFIAKHMKWGRQEDAHEFLRYVIDALHQTDLIGYEKLDASSKETTMPYRIFGGYLKSTVICLKCQNKSEKLDPFLDVCLDIKNAQDVRCALKKFVTPDILGGDNMYNCRHCKSKANAQKYFKFHTLPNVFTIQLKRYLMNGDKIGRHISFPEQLNMSSFLSADSNSANIYNLYSVLVHEGSSRNSGHYYCYVKAANNAWYCMNDSHVSPTNLQNILRAQAYILFYIRETKADLNITKQSYNIKSESDSKTHMSNKQVEKNSLTSFNYLNSLITNRTNKLNLNNCNTPELNKQSNQVSPLSKNSLSSKTHISYTKDNVNINSNSHLEKISLNSVDTSNKTPFSSNIVLHNNKHSHQASSAFQFEKSNFTIIKDSTTKIPNSLSKPLKIISNETEQTNLLGIKDPNTNNLNKISEKIIRPPITISKHSLIDKAEKATAKVCKNITVTSHKIEKSQNSNNKDNKINFEDLDLSNVKTNNCKSELPAAKRCKVMLNNSSAVDLKDNIVESNINHLVSENKTINNKKEADNIDQKKSLCKKITSTNSSKDISKQFMKKKIKNNNFNTDLIINSDIKDKLKLSFQNLYDKDKNLTSTPNMPRKEFKKYLKLMNKKKLLKKLAHYNLLNGNNRKLDHVNNVNSLTKWIVTPIDADNKLNSYDKFKKTTSSTSDNLNPLKMPQDKVLVDNCDKKTFDSQCPTIKWDSNVSKNYKSIQINGQSNPQDKNKLNWDGKFDNRKDVASHLKTHSQLFGCEIKSWSGDKNSFDALIEENKSQKRSKFDGLDEEIDEGRVRKKKLRKVEKEEREENIFQKFQNFKNTEKINSFKINTENIKTN